MIAILAQTLTAGAQAVADSIGWGGLAGIGATLLGIVLAHLRGVRLLAPVVTMIEWFRSHGARDLPLDGLGLSSDEQERVRARVQSWLWTALKDAAMQFAGQFGLLAAFDKRVRAITEPLKLGEGAAPPVTIVETVERAKKTTGVMAAFRPDGLPKLALLPLALALLLGAGGCVGAAVHDGAIQAQVSAKTLRAATIPNPAYNAEEREALGRLWESHERLLRAIEEASK